MGLPSRTVGAKATEDRWSGPSSDQGTYKRPSGANADGAATVRNVLPWRSVEKELAKRLAEKAAKGELPRDVPSAPSSVPRPRTSEREIEPPPDSGVRPSVAGLRATAPAEDSERSAPRALTYSMYTVSELDEARPAPMSTPRIAAPAPSEWVAVLASGQVLGRVLWSWARLAKPRPPLKGHAAVPFAALRADAWSALRALPWRKIGWATLIAFGTVVLFLVAVVTVAELTDDLKPARGATTPKYSLTVAPAPTSAPPPVAEVRSFDGATAAPQLAQIELDDEPVTHPAVKAPVAKTKARGKKAKPADIFLP